VACGWGFVRYDTNHPANVDTADDGNADTANSAGSYGDSHRNANPADAYGNAFLASAYGDNYADAGKRH
jgi:hypothetical protein